MTRLQKTVISVCWRPLYCPVGLHALTKQAAMLERTPTSEELEPSQSSSQERNGSFFCFVFHF